jgi:hypothetical protein
VAAWAAGADAFAQEPDNKKHSKPSLIAEHAAVSPGGTFLGALKLEIDDTWHVYWKNPGDSGLPPKADWSLPEGVSVGNFKWPAPEAIPVATLMNYGYAHKLVLPAEFTIPATCGRSDGRENQGWVSRRSDGSRSCRSRQVRQVDPLLPRRPGDRQFRRAAGQARRHRSIPCAESV